MCEELNEELENGSEIAYQLVDHMIAMGADQCTIPVWYNGEHYQVEVTLAYNTRG